MGVIHNMRDYLKTCLQVLLYRKCKKRGQGPSNPENHKGFTLQEVDPCLLNNTRFHMHFCKKLFPFLFFFYELPVYIQYFRLLFFYNKLNLLGLILRVCEKQILQEVFTLKRFLAKI